MSITIQQAIDRLIDALQDEEYRYGWQSNIAMAFMDAWTRHNRPRNDNESEAMHRLSNAAAAAFLDQLIGRSIDELDGMAAVNELHAQASPIPPRPKVATKVLKSYSITLERDETGQQWIHRRNDGFNIGELITTMEAAKLDLLLQSHTELAERTKRTIITRTVEHTQG